MRALLSVEDPRVQNIRGDLVASAIRDLAESVVSW